MFEVMVLTQHGVYVSCLKWLHSHFWMSCLNEVDLFRQHGLGIMPDSSLAEVAAFKYDVRWLCNTHLALVAVFIQHGVDVMPD